MCSFKARIPAVDFLQIHLIIAFCKYFFQFFCKYCIFIEDKVCYYYENWFNSLEIQHSALSSITMQYLNEKLIIKKQINFELIFFLIL